MNFNLVVPMAGAGSRFQEQGYDLPKPLIDVNGKPMFVRSIDNLIEDFGVEPQSITFVIDRSQDQTYRISDVIKRHYGEYSPNIVALNKRTTGAAMTLRAAGAYLPSDEAVIVMNCDQYVDVADTQGYGFEDFLEDYDAGIVTFFQEQPDPRWSYAVVENDLVIRVAEKDPISQLATVGIYYWSTAGMMFTSIEDMMAMNDRTNNEFYVCPAFNYTIKNGHRVGVYSVREMHGLGTPEDLEKYLGL